MGSNNVKIRKFQILYLPLLIALLSFSIISLLSYNVSYRFMENQMTDNSSKLVELLSRKILNELDHNEKDLNQITESLMNVGNYTLNNKEQISKMGTQSTSL